MQFVIKIEDSELDRILKTLNKLDPHLVFFGDTIKDIVKQAQEQMPKPEIKTNVNK